MVFALAAATPLRAGDVAITIGPAVLKAEKGHVLDLTVLLEAAATVGAVTIVPVAPQGFEIEAVPLNGLPGYRIAEGGTVTLDRLEAGSSVTVPFRMRTPAQFLVWEWVKGLFTGVAARGLDATRGSQSLTFNVSYDLGEGPSVRRACSTVSTDFTYTTSLALFLVAGLAGVILGYVAKSLTKDAAAVGAAMGTERGLRRQVRGLVRFLFVTRLAQCLTSLLVGLAILFTVAHDGIPVGGWIAAVVVGLGIGVLADEGLLARLG